MALALAPLAKVEIALPSIDHSRTVPSPPADTIRERPAKQTLVTGLVWPATTRSSVRLGTELDRVEPTPAREQLPWDDEARALLERLVEGQPMLVRISAAKHLRDRAERRARDAGQGRVSAGLVMENLE